MVVSILLADYEKDIASFIAKAGNLPLSEVMESKAADNAWRAAATSPGVTREQLKAASRDIASTRLAKNSPYPKRQAYDLCSRVTGLAISPWPTNWPKPRENPSQRCRRCVP